MNVINYLDRNIPAVNLAGPGHDLKLMNSEH